ncbi:MAG: peptidylprolyl isomerase [Verrucomicrobiota bacterium JB022]|nr:peptidylprolyl isomerase [Verrucomicrobiota bacterium JB022]
MTHQRLRPLTTLLLLGALGSQASAQKLILAKLESQREFDIQTTGTINLDDFFRIYESDPTATFTVLLPTLSGTTIEGITRYGNLAGRDFTRNEPGFVTEEVPYEGGTIRRIQLTPTAIQVRLLPDEVPNAVANFMTYAADQAYDNTIVQRNPGAGFYGPPDFKIAQAGGYTVSSITEEISSLEDWEFGRITANSAVIAEKGQPNAQYTLAGATANNIFRSEWYFNLNDNTEGLGSNFPVFGKVEAQAAKNALDLMAQVPAFDMTGLWGFNNDLGIFMNVPLMVNGEQTANGVINSHEGYIWGDSFLRFTSVRLDDEGLGAAASSDPAVTFSWIPLEELEDEDNDGDKTDNDGGYLYDKDSFEISLQGGNLSVTTLKPGMMQIQLTAKKGEDEEKLSMTLFSANKALTDFFTTATSVVLPTKDEETWNAYYNTGFGRVFDYGFPNVFIPLYGPLWIDVAEGSNDVNGFWAYDFRISRWMWTKNTHSSQLYVSGDGADNSGWVYTRLEDHDNDAATPRLRWIYIYPLATGDTGVWVNADGNETPPVEPFSAHTLRYWLDHPPVYTTETTTAQ